jgi:uncharacterized protein
MKLIKKVEKFAKENLGEMNLLHVQDVRKIARKLAKAEGANAETVDIASLLHDIGKEKSSPLEHHIKGVEIAKNLLQELNADKKLTDEVLHCIDAHMMQTELPNAPRPKTIEAKVVFDADMINLISPFGIAKLIFMRAKEKTFTESVDFAKKTTEAAYRELKTESAKKLAEKYWKLNRKFFKKFE